jgi:hypothetical protein
MRLTVTVLLLGIAALKLLELDRSTTRGSGIAVAAGILVAALAIGARSLVDTGLIRRRVGRVAGLCYWAATAAVTAWVLGTAIGAHRHERLFQLCFPDI